MRHHLLGAFAALLLPLAGCSFPVDADTAKINCGPDADCPSGQVCVTQVLTGQGICFLASQCGAETCNGLDDDCDGVVDDHLTDVGQACDTTGKDVCPGYEGVASCQDGQTQCLGQVLKSAGCP
jgi:hypothetical protein